MKNIKLLNLNCRDASRLVSEGLHRDLSFMERIGLRLHLMICSGCRAWRRQLLFIRQVLRGAPEEPGSPDDSPQAKLSDEARERIRRALEATS